MTAMSHHQLEHTLRDLQQRGTRIEQANGREVWQFEFAEHTYRLHFYSKRDGRATREYRGLTALQRADIPAPRAIALLSGFRLGERIGDAVVLESADQLRPIGEFSVSHRQRVVRVSELLKKLGEAKLGHDALTLENLAVDPTDRVMLLEGEAVTRDGLRLHQVLKLDHAARHLISTADRLRAWRTFGFNAEMPATNRITQGSSRKGIRESLRGENSHSGKLIAGKWRGRFTKQSGVPISAAAPSAVQRQVSQSDWKSAWPALLSAVENDQLKILKRGDSGDVLRGDVVLGGVPLRVVVKRPKRKSLRQAIVDSVRPSRARRTWIKTWKMLVRDVPCEWPLLLMEKRRFGYVVDAILVFGWVDGPTLADIDLDKLSPAARRTLFHRAGRTLRRIESLGFTHMDAKSTNWIAADAATEKPRPMLVDLDGVRHYRWTGAGIERLLRAMKNHPQYTPEDSFNLCFGYAPRATIGIEPEPTGEPG